MKNWYASVNYGLEPAVGKIIKALGAENIKTLDSAVTFSHPGEIKAACINNLFLVLSSYLSENILDAANKLARLRLRFPEIKGKTFRLVVMDCGKLCPIPGKIMAEIEKSISRQAKLSANRARPDVEIWLNRRNDNAVYLMLRMKKHRAFDKALKKGELRPDIVDIMLREANVNKNSVIADLFGGWGAVAAAAAESGQYQMIYTGDISNECVNHQKTRLRKKPNCVVQKWDARKLPLKDMSVDAVVTDPPWGEYEKINTAQFYDGFIAETARVLRQSGSFVFLSSAKTEAQDSLKKYGFNYSYIPLKIAGKETFLFSAGFTQHRVDTH